MPDHEYLKKVTVVPLEKHNNTIQLCEYDPSWAKTYLKLAKEIKEVLKDEIILLEHVGSTSVPGLCAKPIIDILLEVLDSSKEERYIQKLESIGYVLRIREPDWYQHRCLKRFAPDVNLHVFSKGCIESMRMIQFRDRLCSNVEDRELYAKTKRKLAHREWEYVQDYANEKSQVVKEIMSHIRVEV